MKPSHSFGLWRWTSQGEQIAPDRPEVISAVEKICSIPFYTVAIESAHKKNDWFIVARLQDGGISSENFVLVFGKLNIQESMLAHCFFVKIGTKPLNRAENEL